LPKPAPATMTTRLLSRMCSCNVLRRMEAFRCSKSGGDTETPLSSTKLSMTLESGASLYLNVRTARLSGGWRRRASVLHGGVSALWWFRSANRNGDPPRMNASLRRSLRPGGTLAIIEFAPRGHEAPTPGDRAGDGSTAFHCESALRIRLRMRQRPTGQADVRIHRQ